MDTFWFSNGSQIQDATPEDRIVAFNLDLEGGFKRQESESPWAAGAWLFQYGINGEGGSCH